MTDPGPVELIDRIGTSGLDNGVTVWSVLEYRGLAVVPRQSQVLLETALTLEAETRGRCAFSSRSLATCSGANSVSGVHRPSFPKRVDEGLPVMPLVRNEVL